MLKELFVAAAGNLEWRFSWREVFAEIVPLPRGVSSTVSRALLAWFAFLLVGAVLNAIEFPGFEVYHLTEPQIGYVLAAWGAGSLLAFVLPLPSLSQTLSASLYVVALAVFVLGGNWWTVVLSFFFAGGLSAYFSGALRARLQASVGPKDNPAVLWAYANQVTQIINLISYSTAGLLLTSIGFYGFGAAMLVGGVLLVALTILAARSNMTA